MSTWARACPAAAAILIAATPAAAQNFPTDDPVIQAIWEEGMDRSHVYDLAQVLANFGSGC